MIRLGLHLSIQGSLDLVIDRGVERGCNTLQMFSRNPRGWESKNLSSHTVENFRNKLKKSGIWPIFIHTPYLLNLASPKDTVYNRSVNVLKDELRRATELGVPYVVTHLGSHLGYGKMEGFKRIANAVNNSLLSVEGNVILLLENTAGTRNSMGSSFEDIKHILDRIKSVERVGLCFDTAHAFAAGYDLVSRGAVQYTLKHLDRVVGLGALKLVHLNDSKGALGSRIDRHEHIGMGMIGEQGFMNILQSRLGKLPLILETPIDERRNDIGNLEKVKELAIGTNS